MIDSKVLKAVSEIREVVKIINGPKSEFDKRLKSLSDVHEGIVKDRDQAALLRQEAVDTMAAAEKIQSESEKKMVYVEQRKAQLSKALADMRGDRTELEADQTAFTQRNIELTKAEREFAHKVREENDRLAQREANIQAASEALIVREDNVAAREKRIADLSSVL